MKIPNKGLGKDDVFKALKSFKGDDLDWKSGRVLGYVYYPGDKAQDVINEAYTMWKDLCEDPRFTCEVEWPEHSCVVLNNHFVLHGRATPVPGSTSERVMVWGYTRKDITEMRYRLLQQRRLELEKGISDDCTRNIPNQVLMSM